MIPFRVIRSGLLLTGLMAALGGSLTAASNSFTAALTDQQKSEAGLTNLSGTELAALDRLVAADLARGRPAGAPTLSDRFSLRYSEAESNEAGLDQLTPAQLVKLDELIASTIASAPAPRAQPRERPRLRDDGILTRQARLQVHGGVSFTYGWAGGGRNFRETGAWVSYFDPVTGFGLGLSFSRYSGDVLGGYYGRDYYPSPSYFGPGSRSPLADFEPVDLDRGEFSGSGISPRPAVMGRPAGRGSRL